MRGLSQLNLAAWLVRGCAKPAVFTALGSPRFAVCEQVSCHISAAWMNCTYEYAKNNSRETLCITFETVSCAQKDRFYHTFYNFYFQVLLNTPIVPSTRYGAAACRYLCLVCKWDRRDLRSTMVHIRHAGPSRWACSWPQLRRKTSGTRVWVLEYHGTSLAGLLARGTVHPSGPAYISRQM